MSKETMTFPGAASQFDGMTLRDYFAAKAMQAMITGYLSNEKGGESGFKFYEGDHIHAASAAYSVADAMLAERNK